MKNKILYPLYPLFFSSTLFSQELDLSEEVLKQVITTQVEKTLDKVTKEAKESTLKDADLQDPQNKSGFLLGTGLTLKELGFSQVIAGFESLVVKNPSLDVGLLLGYQYYGNQYFGFRISGMINTGGKAELKAPTIRPASKTNQTALQESNKISATLIRDVMQIYYPIKANADIKLLLDVYTNEKHSVGFSLGVGYEAEWLIAGQASAKVEQAPNGLEKLTQKPNTLRDSAVYPTIGFHYYYGKHQFEIDYKFAEYSFGTSDSWKFNAGESKIANTFFSVKNTLAISYIYRF